MKDLRLEKLAKSLLNYSVEVKEGHHVMIRGDYEAKPLLLELIRECKRIGAHPYVQILDDEISREINLATKKERLDKIIKWTTPKYEDIDASIGVYADRNDYANVDVPVETKLLRAKKLRPLNDIIINTKKWVILNYPTHTLAHKAKMSYEQFYDYCMKVSLVDYSKMKEAFKPLAELINKTDKVKIIGPGTDISFSIKGYGSEPCSGECNIPDGEIYTAPVIDSVNGVITYNTPSANRGTVFNKVSLTFENGKIINSTCDGDNDKLKEIFDTDEGARFVGEFAIGVNPYITKSMGDILYDEKIAGSIHFTPGQAYLGPADNGNRSAIHWDLVLIQTEEYGGGEIYFDDILIRKDGIFVLESLKGLNPENLK
ncbi:aminopeptidase [Mycoplasmatota bacterium]|nr:aminopeptidase [Mycoplasmatota bacterium]